MTTLQCLLCALALIFMPCWVQITRGQLIHTLGDASGPWITGPVECTLATPKIKFINGEMAAELKDRSINMEEGEEAWLGYVLDSVILQNIGCIAYNPSDEPRLSTYIDTGADPGLCYSACGEKGFVGIMKTKCFCFNTVPSLSPEDMYETTCRHTCSKLNDEASCGGNNVVSLYTSADGMAVSDVEDFPLSRNSGNCVLYDKNAKKYYATKCTMSYRIGCQRRSGDMVDINSRTVNWLEMIGYCASNQLLPYTHQGVLQDDGEYFQVWTGMIRARKLYERSEVSGEPLGIAYVKVENGHYKVRFSSPISTDEKKFICQEGVETTTMPDIVTNLAIDENDESDFDVKTSKDVEETSLLPLFIVLPIVLILVAIIIFLLVIRWRRKKRNEKLKSGSSKKLAGKTDNRKDPQCKNDSSKQSNDTDNLNYSFPDMSMNAGNRKTSLSGNMVATVSLDNLLVDNHDGRNKGETTFTNYSEKIPNSKNYKNANKRPTKTDKVQSPNTNSNAPIDNEYARINKRKHIGPNCIQSEQKYDTLGAVKRDEKDSKADNNFDKTTFAKTDPDSTSKQMTIPESDDMYDGLHRF